MSDGGPAARTTGESSAERVSDSAYALAGIGSLVRDLDGTPPYQLEDALGERLRDILGAVQTTLLLADYAEQRLTVVGGGETTPIDGSVEGRAYADQRMVEVNSTDRITMCLPITIRAERLGVLRVVLPTGSATARDYLAEVAQVLGYLISAAGRYTDRFERIRRAREMQLAAEIQWSLLPVLAYECAEYAVAGSLEPAYEVGGDTFDYAVGPDTLTLSVTDAMGHGLRAALMASLTSTAMRNERRRGSGPAQQVQAAAEHLIDQFGEPGYVSGVLIELDAATGRGRAVNAGHPPPLLMRDGTVTTLELTPHKPMGMFAGDEHPAQPVALVPGDRLLLYTDGITESLDAGGQRLGESGLARFVAESRSATPSGVVRLLTKLITERTIDNLTDDATAVCVDWRGR
jgi:serine phosphatase RsbU (regulator of sigma subunit)